jgi:hypothetical protein
MATRNEVLTLFGATPQQIAEKQRREQAAMVLSQQDPYAKAGTAIGVGLGRLFGGKSAEVIEAEQLQEARTGIDLQSVEGMRAAAARLAQAGFEDRSLQLLDLASRREAEEQRQGLAGNEVIQKEIYVPVKTTDPVTGDPVTKQVKINVPYYFDPKTKATTPIFGTEYEESLAKQQLENIAVTVETETTPLTPKERLEQKQRKELTDLAVGGIYRLPTTGRFVRKLPDGKFEYLTQEQIDEAAGINPEQMRSSLSP